MSIFKLGDSVGWGFLRKRCIKNKTTVYCEYLGLLELFVLDLVKFSVLLKLAT